VNTWENPQANVVKPTGKPMTITLGEASRQTGKTKSTILKALRTGRVSGIKDDKGEWQIDPAELFRVYAPASSPANDSAPEVNAATENSDGFRPLRAAPDAARKAA
jgi:hypothetical protein